MHPRLRTRRVDHAGALVLAANPPEAFDADSVRHGFMTFYGNVPGRPVGIPI